MGKGLQASFRSLDEYNEPTFILPFPFSPYLQLLESTTYAASSFMFYGLGDNFYLFRLAINRETVRP